MHDFVVIALWRQQNSGACRRPDCCRSDYCSGYCSGCKSINERWRCRSASWEQSTVEALHEVFMWLRRHPWQSWHGSNVRAMAHWTRDTHPIRKIEDQSLDLSTRAECLQDAIVEIIVTVKTCKQKITIIALAPDPNIATHQNDHTQSDGSTAKQRCGD